MRLVTLGVYLPNVLHSLSLYCGHVLVRDQTSQRTRLISGLVRDFWAPCFFLFWNAFHSNPSAQHLPFH